MLDSLLSGPRWRPFAAAGGVIVIVVLVLLTVTSGSSTVLPAPPHVVSSPKSSHGSTHQVNQPAQVTPFGSAPLTGCTASVSDPSPPQSATAETITVVSAPGAQVRMEADYARTRSIHTGLGDASGKDVFSLPIQHAQPGVIVPVKVTASLLQAHVSCGSSFTPAATAPVAGLPFSTFAPVTKLLPGAPPVSALPPLPPPPPSPPVVVPPPTLPPPTTTPPTTTPPTTTPPTTTPPTTTPPTTTPPTTTPPTTTPPTTTPPTTTPPTTTPPTTTPPTTTPPTTTPPTLPLPG